MDMKKIREIMENGNYEEKNDLLSHLNDIFESYNKNIKDFDEIISFLIDYATRSGDENLSISIFEAITNAQTYQDTKNVNFDKIALATASAPTKILIELIEILSYTYNRKYLSTIMKYKDHPNIYVRQAVKDALIEFGIS